MWGSRGEPQQLLGIAIQRDGKVAKMIDGAGVPSTEICAEHQPIGTKLLDGENKLGFAADVTIEPEPVNGGVECAGLSDPRW